MKEERKFIRVQHPRGKTNVELTFKESTNPSVIKNHQNIGIVIMAAGISSRLGQPKQLLQYKGVSLIRRAVQAAVDTGVGTVITVLGANSELVKKEIKDDTVHVEENKDWEEGMASSIRCGVAALCKITPPVEGVILMVCDQPHVTTSLLQDLITAHLKTNKPIVTCSYENTFGPPVFFHRTLFPELLQLKGDVGARGVIKQQVNSVEVVSFPDGTIDIDTESDYNQLSQEKDKP